MARRFRDALETAIFAIAAQTDRGKLATLKGERPANRRLCRVMYWLKVAENAGTPPLRTLDLALKSYADAPAHRALVKEQLLRSYRHLEHFGCFEPEVFGTLKNGRSPYVQRGRFVGEHLWVEHIIPRARAPELANEFANLGFTRQSENQQKSSKVGPFSMATARRLLTAGILTQAKLAELQGLATGAPGFSAGAAGRTMGSIFGGGGATDPRMIIPRVQGLAESIEDWERRAGTALGEAEYVQMHAAEQVSRMVPRLGAAQNRLVDDRAAVTQLRREVEHCTDRCRDIEQRANAAYAEAAKAARASTHALQRWRQELRSAHGWLAAAQHREAEAEAERHRAQYALNSALSDLRQAEAELESARHRTEYCGRDREGNALYRPIDTTPYERAVQHAASAVHECERELAAAEAELRAAVADRLRAEARVRACENAVRLCEQAARQSEEAVEHATRTQAAGERAFEEQRRAARCLEATDLHFSTLDTQLSEAHVRHIDSQTAQNGAQSAVKHAADMLADARLRSTKGRAEMEWRLDKLRAFDAPMTGF